MRRRLLALAAPLLLALALPCESGAQDVVPVVSASSPLRALNPGQLADIFLGKTSRFPDGSYAVPIDLAEDSPLRDKFYTQFTGKSAAQLRAHWSKIIFTGRGQPPKHFDSSEQAKRAIAGNPHAIGYIDPRLVDDSVRVLALR